MLPPVADTTRSHSGGGGECGGDCGSGECGGGETRVTAVAAMETTAANDAAAFLPTSRSAMMTATS